MPVDAGGPGATVRDATPAATVRDATPGATSRDPTPAVRSCSLPGWRTVNAMKQLRMDHTATRLDDDTVLVAGGVIGPGPIAEAEFYDPVKDTWTDAGTLHERRGGHEAVLLDNHEVLVVGGSGGPTGPTFHLLASAELYDPGTNTWTPTGGLTSARSGTATKLGDGKVLFAAGDTNAGASARSEIYDPTTGLWSITGDLNQARSGHTATLLGDRETVLVVGGSATGTALTSAETYDPSTGKWTTVGSLEEPRSLIRATLLQNGKVLVTGGSTTAENAAELYDPDSKTWSKATSMGEPRYYHTSTPLLDGTVLVAGGTSGPSGGMLYPTVTTAKIYDASVDKWTSAGTLVPAVSQHAATLLNDGSVLVTGGFDGSVAINGAQIYCPP